MLSSKFKYQYKPEFSGITAFIILMKAKYLIPYLVLICHLCNLCLSEQQMRLIQVQQLTRHGARYSFSPLYQTLVSSKYHKTHQFRQLTSQGKHMHYILGKLLYQKYWKLLFANTKYEYQFHSPVIQVWSTNTNRTISSIQSQLIGLLQDLKPQKLPNNHIQISQPPNILIKKNQQKDQHKKGYFNVFGKDNKYHHTVAIHTQPVMESAGFKVRYRNRAQKIGGNFLTWISKKKCPIRQQWQIRNFKSQEAVLIQQNQAVKKFIAAASKVIGIPVSFSLASSIVDQSYVHRHLGLPMLQLFYDNDMAQAGDFIRVTFNHFSYFYSEMERRIAGTSMIQTIIANINRAIKDQRPRFIIYGAHDSTLQILLAALQMQTLDCIMQRFINKTDNSESCISQLPPYASTIIVELWETEIQLHHFIKILYNGEERKIPVCNNKILCPLEEFQKWANNFYLDNPWKSCGLPDIQFQD